MYASVPLAPPIQLEDAPTAVDHGPRVGQRHQISVESGIATIALPIGKEDDDVGCVAARIDNLLGGYETGGEISACPVRVFAVNWVAPAWPVWATADR